jgi:hypothetical protein
MTCEIYSQTLVYCQHKKPLDLNGLTSLKTLHIIE